MEHKYTLSIGHKNIKDDNIFQPFKETYEKYLKIYEDSSAMDEQQQKNLPIFIYTYLLLECYVVAFNESQKPLAKFDVDSWWFFTAGDFSQISKELDFEKIINNFNKIIGANVESVVAVPNQGDVEINQNENAQVNP